MSTEGKTEIISDAGEFAPPTSEPVGEVIGSIGESITIPEETPATGQPDREFTPSRLPPDSAGEYFNPAIHFPDGRKTKTGKFRRKCGGSEQPEITATGTAPENSAPANLTPEAAGKTFAGLFFAVGAGLLGADFLPENAQERKSVEESIANYCAVSGAVDLPPSLALAIALIGYVGAKVAAKKTVRERLIDKFMAIKKLITGE